MLRAYKYRIYPTEEQKVLLAKTFGCCRFVYNWALNLKIEAYKQEKKSIGNVELTNRMRSELKTEHEWLGEVNSQALQSALRNLDTAYKNFFRDTHAVGFPRFKSRRTETEFSVSAALQRGLRKGDHFHTQGKRYSCRTAPQVQGYREDRYRQHDTFGQILCFRSG